METCVVLGGDLRFQYLSRLFKDSGCTVYTEPYFEKRAAFYLPLTASENDLRMLANKVLKGSLVVAGKASDQTRALFHQKGIDLFLLLENELYRKQNALATAEGALCEAICRTPRTLAGRACLVLGYGACGSAIARLFRFAGCKVSVYSHENSLLRAEKDGFLPCRDLEKEAASFDFVFNTIPHPTLPEAFFSGLAKGCIFFQIASGLSGLSPDLFDVRGATLVPLPGLPARYAPQTEAETIDFLTTPYRKESDLF